MFISKMTKVETRAVLSLSSIISLRMIGLFMVLPVFTLYVRQLQGATPMLIGFAIGIYGLSQAIFQIPLGALSDRIGRKPVIFAGLLIFVIGSVIAAYAHAIELMILGRTLQGIGAVGSTLLAMMADLTSESHRTKSMAIAGITIGCSFAIAMLLGPILIQWIKVNELFLLAAGFGLIAMGMLYAWVPNSPPLSFQPDENMPELKSFFKLIQQPELAKLNLGILFLHAIFTASFIALPLSLDHFTKLDTHHQWVMYLPTLLIAFTISLFCIGFAEKNKQHELYFILGIVALTFAEGLFWLFPSKPLSIALGLILFFSGFSLLEAFLPSLVSKTAPATRKGTALGIYSCSQFLGIFIGGMLGGYLYGKFSFSGVYIFCILLAFFWLTIAAYTHKPRYLLTEVWQLPSSKQTHWAQFLAKLQILPGMIEVVLIAENSTIYLKMEQSTIKHPDFIRLKEQLQSELIYD